MNNEAVVARLERELQDLILEWERFFSKDRRLPPQKERAELTRRIRRVFEHGVQGSAARFRLEQLQHRLNTYNQLWERQLREREEGRRSGVWRRPGARRGDAGRPSSVQGGGEAPSLYDRYVREMQRLGQRVAVDRREFEDRVQRQKCRAERKLGRPVTLDVVVDDGKVRLAARAVKRGESG